MVSKSSKITTFLLVVIHIVRSLLGLNKPKLGVKYAADYNFERSIVKFEEGS